MLNANFSYFLVIEDNQAKSECISLIFSKLNLPKSSHLFCGLNYEILKSFSSSSNKLDHLFVFQFNAVFFTTLTLD